MTSHNASRTTNPDLPRREIGRKEHGWFNIKTTVEARIIAEEWIKLSQNLQKKRHNKKIVNNSFNKNDLVLEFRSKDQNIYGDKFQSKWNGPFYIETVLGKGAYILRTLEGRVLQHHPVHSNRIKLYYSQEPVTP